MSKLLYLENSTIKSAFGIVLEVNATPDGCAVVLDATPFYVKGGGQPSDTGMLIGDTGQFQVMQVIRVDGMVQHAGKMLEGNLRTNDLVVATIDVEVRRRHSRLHTAGEAICAAVHELGRRWPVTAASHVPGQARVAFACDLMPEEVAGFAEQLQHRFEEIVASDTPIVARTGVAIEEAQRLCPMDADALSNKADPIRLISPIPGFYRPCMGAHLERCGQIGEIAFRKFRLRNGELSISYDLA